MKKRVWGFLIILSLALNIAFVGMWGMHAIRRHCGSGTSCGGREEGGGALHPLHRKLGMTEEQQRQIEPKLVEFQRGSQKICQSVNQKRAELIDLLSAAEPDREAIVAKQEEILTGQRQVQQLVIEHLLAEREILTPEQRKSLFDMFRRRSRCAGHGPGIMGLPGGGFQQKGHGCAGSNKEGVPANGSLDKQEEMQ